MAAQRKPNLILFLPDQQRADTLACYGGVKVHAPNLNKLASESVVFERTYVTHPVCTPSRSSLMTGTWPHINGCTRNSVPLDRRFRVFPELMQDQDYRTAYIGKWHLGEDGPAGRGFQHWISTDDHGDYTNFLISNGVTPNKPNGRFSEVAISNLPIELSRPKFLEKHACDFIEKHQRDPFILVVAFVEPHSPYNGPLNDVNPLDEVELDADGDASGERRHSVALSFDARMAAGRSAVGSGAAADSVVLRDYTRRIPQHQATLPRARSPWWTKASAQFLVVWNDAA